MYSYLICILLYFISVVNDGPDGDVTEEDFQNPSGLLTNKLDRVKSEAESESDRLQRIFMFNNLITSYLEIGEEGSQDTQTYGEAARAEIESQNDEAYERYFENIGQTIGENLGQSKESESVDACSVINLILGEKSNCE